MSQKSVVGLNRLFAAQLLTVACVILTMNLVAQAQDKSAPAKASVSGGYEGTAKNKVEEVITVAIDLTEKEGALSGVIHSSHGDFPITGGSHQGDAVTIEFDAGGPGTISFHLTGDKLVGTWTAGEDGGPVDVKKVPAQDGGTKGKS